MTPLSKSEEQLMEFIWSKKFIYLNELIDCFEKPHPASSTIATLLKRMQTKGYVGFNITGNSRAYYAMVTKDKYFSKQVRGMINNFFDNSPAQFASFFTKKMEMSRAQLLELRKMIDDEITKKSIK